MSRSGGGGGGGGGGWVARGAPNVLPFLAHLGKGRGGGWYQKWGGSSLWKEVGYGGEQGYIIYIYIYIYIYYKQMHT